MCAAYRRNAGVLLAKLDRAYGGASETRTALDRLLARSAATGETDGEMRWT